MSAQVILYVEDDDAAFALAALILGEESPSTRLVRACNGEEALAMLLNRPPHQDALRPDLILLDLNMPKKNGFEVLVEIKGIESLRSIPVVMFSTASAGTEIRDSQTLGAKDYVVKPTSFDAFVEAVRTACSLPKKAAGAPRSE